MPALSMTLFAILLPAALLLAAATAPYTLVLGDLLAVNLPGQWNVSGVDVDITDLVFAGLVVAVALQRGWLRRWSRGGIPHLGLWIGSAALLLFACATARDGSTGVIDPLWLGLWVYAAFVALLLLLRTAAPKTPTSGLPYVELWIVYGTLLSMAYLHAPANQENFTSPLAVAYQLYRYSWKPILYYVLVSLLLGDRNKVRTVLLSIVVAADIFAVQAIVQGYSGGDVLGPFITKNQLGGCLIVPLVLAVSGLLYPASTRHRVFHLVSSLLLFRALTMTASRGAFIAGLLGVAFLFSGMSLAAGGRKRLLRFAAVVVVGAACLAILRPHLLQGPAIQELLALRHGIGAENLQWRLEERWPYFWNLLVQHPWFGVGTEVDPTLGLSGNTPHNGYLALAVSNGVPAILIFLLLSALGVFHGLRAFRHSPDPWHRTMGLTLAAALFGLYVHNVIDSTFLLAFANKTFWLLASLAAVLGRCPQTFALAREQTIAAAPPEGRTSRSLVLTGARA